MLRCVERRRVVPQPITDGITVDATNGALFTSIAMQPGDYWLVETKAPDGHTLLPAPVKFTLTATGITLDSTHGALVEMKDGNAFTIELPLTGGEGVAALSLSGLALIGGGVAYYAVSSRKRREV